MALPAPSSKSNDPRTDTFWKVGNRAAWQGWIVRCKRWFRRIKGAPKGPLQVHHRWGRLKAESARGISPRAGHRSVRDSLPSHGSCRPRELPPPRQRPAGSSCCQLAHYGLGVDDLPLHSTDMTPLHRDDEVVRPLVSHPYSRPRGSIHCWLLRLHRHRRWFGSHSCKSVRGAPSLISFTVTQNIKPFRVSRFARGTARK